MRSYSRGTTIYEIKKETPLERAENELLRLNKTIEMFEKRKEEVIKEIAKLKEASK